MVIAVITTKEYECERCGWKWVRRLNGKDLEGEPIGCARCKTDLWNIPRKNSMLLGSYWLARYKGKEQQKRTFVHLFNNRTDKEWYNLEQNTRDKMLKLAYDIMKELDINPQ